MNLLTTTNDGNAEEYAVERFRLDPSAAGDLAALIEEAFVTDSQEEGGTIAFDEETFRFMFGSPGVPADLFVRVVHRPTGRVVGFLGAIPRLLSVEGRTYKFAVPAWLAVHSEHQRRGLAHRMGSELLEMGRERGFDGGLSFFEPEAHGIDTARAVARDADMPLRELLTIRKFVIRVFDVGRAASVVSLKWYERLGLRLIQGVGRLKNPRVRRARPDDAGALFELMADHVERNQVSVVREREDFVWYVNQPGVNCVVHEDGSGGVDGFILAWKFNMAGFGRTVPFGWLDLVHTYRLAPGDAADLCRYLCVTSKELGWAGLQCPFIPYFDPAPFRKARFVFFPKELVVGLFPLREVPLPDEIRSIYFDWR
ncbi:MAG: GNAT family N-acetyltransferase [Promethearchaeota archaeon]